jgi:hypothetical protein
MTSKLKFILGAIVGILFTALLLSSCTSESTNQSHWFVDEKGHFHTNDVKLAQEESPFIIVVPDYIPDLFGTDYLCEITGLFKNPLSNYLEVKIQYWDENHQIYISEYNQKSVMLPTEELEPVNYEIAGIQVLRQIAQFLTSSGTIEGLSFNWNTDGLTFEVEIFNIPEKEGIKIVESMIKQMN